MKVALDSFRVLLFDQRGTGRSTPATPQHILSIGSPEAQAEYMSHFRADSIVNDCEIVRDKIAGGKRLTLIGQSFGGFCMLRYLSAYPDAIERCLFTCGLAPVGKPVEEVYRATFKRMEKRNARFYRRYPDEIENVRDLVRILHTSPAKLPRGGTLTARRFLSLGLMLGSGAGLEKLHDLLELAKAPGAPAGELPELFLRGVDDAEAFSTNPIYWLLHESIYCDGPGSASAWAAERARAGVAPGLRLHATAGQGRRADSLHRRDGLQMDGGGLLSPPVLRCPLPPAHTHSSARRRPLACPAGRSPRPRSCWQTRLTGRSCTTSTTSARATPSAAH